MPTFLQCLCAVALALAVLLQASVAAAAPGATNAAPGAAPRAGVRSPAVAQLTRAARGVHAAATQRVGLVRALDAVLHPVALPVAAWLPRAPRGGRQPNRRTVDACGGRGNTTACSDYPSTCWWDYNENTCRQIACQDMADATACAAFAGESCTWDSTNYLCHAPGATTCEVFADAFCPSPYCAYSTAYAVCHPVATGVGCGWLSAAQTDCEAAGTDCLWTVDEWDQPICKKDTSAACA